MKISIDFNKIGLIFIGILCGSYMLFNAVFAELHIQIFFLDFPIFVGELFLMFFLVILFLTNKPIQIDRKLRLMIIFYTAFVLFKAIFGYIQFGPLSFRHAALFYYPIFAIFVYHFAVTIKTDIKPLIYAAMSVSLCLLFFASTNYWTFSLGCFLWFLALNINRKYFLIAGSLLFPYSRLLFSSRMMILSNMLAIAYLIFASFIILPIKKYLKWLFILLLIALTVVIFFIGGDTFALKSIFSLRTMKDEFIRNDLLIKQRNYEKKKIININLFNPNRNCLLKKDNSEEGVQKNPESLKGVQKNPESLKGVQKKPESSKGVQKKPESSTDNLCRFGNILFRIFIWRDMLVELKEEKPLLGFSFGKPLRSKSLEILNWGSIEWMRDGWVGAHNSWLHIIYRSGIIGVFFIYYVIFLLIKMTLFYLKHQSMSGILLSAISINWFIAANFLLILELPYTAIPIWCFYGLNYAYYNKMKEKTKETSTR